MADTGIISAFRVTIIIMVFWSFSITTLTYALSGTSAVTMVDSYADVNADMEVEDVGTDVMNSLTRQVNVPVLDVATLVYYSGNMILDLLVNFAYAIPQMFGMLLNGIGRTINIDVQIMRNLQGFASILMTAMYAIGLIQLLAGIRSGRTIA